MADESDRDVLSPGVFGRSLQEFLRVSLELAPDEENALTRRVAAHLAVERIDELPITSRDLGGPDHPNLQTALDHLQAQGGWSIEVVGLRAEHAEMTGGLTMSTFCSSNPYASHFPPTAGPIERVTIDLEPGETIACLVNVLLLIRRQERSLVGLISRAPRMMGGPGLRLELLAADPDHAPAALEEIDATMRQRNVYRGRVLAFTHDDQGGVGITVRQLPEIVDDAIILPDGVLEHIERQALGPSRHRERLLAAGRHLKRGLLMHGPPGTGKTLTVMHVAARLPAHTVVIITGGAFAVLEPAAALARELQPAMVVLEDVDLIAHARAYDDGYAPMLFSLLNEMDGLADDADVLFVLTTNRPDVLEPALAARPGRIDETIELPLPDADARRRLIALYSVGLDVRATNLDELIERLEGASPAHIKELMRKAALIAADSRPDELVVTDEELRQAADRLVILDPATIAQHQPFPFAAEIDDEFE